MSYSPLAPGKQEGDNPPPYTHYPSAPNSGYGNTNHPGSGPVINQPIMGSGGAVDMRMNRPQHIPNCPPGLEYLATLDHLIVHEKWLGVSDLFSLRQRRFIMKNRLGQELYYATEHGNCDNCCSQSLDTEIVDISQNEVIHVRRFMDCTSCLSREIVEVSSPPGTLIGTVEQELSWCYPTFTIKNANGDIVLRILVHLGGFCNFAEFRIVSGDGSVEIGMIQKMYRGFFREIMERDKFNVTFPIDLDVKMKAVLLGACMLIGSDVQHAVIIDPQEWSYSQNLNNRFFFAETLPKLLSGAKISRAATGLTNYTDEENRSNSNLNTKEY